MSTQYISNTGSGLRDGSSWDNAARLTDLSKMVQLASPGGTVLLRADQGDYTLSKEIYLTAGGTAANQVTIMGVDGLGRPMNATISSTANSIFTLKPGADNLAFEHLTLKDTVGSVGAIRIGADISNLTIDHVDAYNVRTFLGDVTSGGVPTASVTGLTVRDVNVYGYSHTGIDLGYNSSNVLIENVKLQGGVGADAYMEGVHLAGTVHNVVLKAVTATNNVYSASGYWNGDGFATERGVYDVHFINTVATGNADAGYDLKSSSTTLDGVYSGDNKHNFRFWSDTITMSNSTGAATHDYGGDGPRSQVWVAAGGTATVTNSTFTDHGAGLIVYDLGRADATLHLTNDTATADGGAMLQQLGVGAVIDVTPPPPPPPPVIAPAPVPVSVSAPATPVQTAPPPVTHSFYGTDKADILKGSSGADMMAGGKAGDVYYVDNLGDQVTELAGGGVDFVKSQVSFTLGANVEKLSLQGTANIDGVGNQLANTILGNGGDNHLSGGAGNDAINGGAGKDVISGGAGADRLAGGAGADQFLFGHGDGKDIITDFSGADTIALSDLDAASASIQAKGLDTLISFQSGETLLLLGVHANEVMVGATGFSHI